jgi:Rrf2 family protein
MTSDFSLAVHALVYLDCKKAMLSSEQLAENVCTNPARVRKVMARLKKAGFISTREGKSGGYICSADAKKLSLLEVFEAVDEFLVCSSWRSGGQDRDCLISSGMAGVMEGIYSRMDSLCRRELERITISDIEDRIFKENASN